jgi:adenylylsulfate kinase-like enzyme
VELEILSEVMQASGPLVIHVQGVSGIGKPALIFEFAAIWRSRKRTVLLLDGRTIEPTEGGFQHELSGSCESKSRRSAALSGFSQNEVGLW